MSNATHIPGPWSIEVDGNTFITGEGRQLAKVLVTHANNNEYSEHLARAKANARLIAAAPDLLAALEEMVNFETLHTFDQIKALCAARAAIAKATSAD